MSSMEQARLIPMPRIYDPRGNLSFIENGDAVLPFTIARAYWIYDVPAGELRGSHSHRQGQELIVAASGSFTVNLFDGKEWQHFTLNRPFEGLYVPPGYWRTLDNFSSASMCLVFSSLPYDEADYVRDYEEFISLSRS